MAESRLTQGRVGLWVRPGQSPRAGTVRPLSACRAPIRRHSPLTSCSAFTSTISPRFARMPRSQESGNCEATADHCIQAFDALSCSFTGEPVPAPRFPQADAPLFVTWNKRKSRTGEYHLRGCIGSLHSRPLNTGVADFALASARDRRFKPITYNELESLSCSVSLLHSFEECAAWDDWVVGRHGIIIRFTAGHGEFSATFLPGVAAEQGWSIKETIEHLIRKAGYQGHISSSLLSNMRVTRYQSSSHSMTHKEWLSSKDEDDSVPSAHTLSTASMTPP